MIQHKICRNVLIHHYQDPVHHSLLLHSQYQEQLQEKTHKNSQCHYTQDLPVDNQGRNLYRLY